MSPSATSSTLSRRFRMVLFAIIALALLAGGFGFYQRKAYQVREEQRQMLAAIGGLKSGQIQSWRRERQADALREARGYAMRSLAGELLRGPGSEKNRTDLLNLLRLSTELSQYQSAMLFSLDGQVLLSTEGSANPVDPATKRAVMAAAAGQDPVLSDFFAHPDGQAHIDAAAKVRDTEGNPIAVVVLRSNAEAFLFPMIQKWPLPNDSAETVLTLRRGDEAFVPHKLRADLETTPRFHSPLTATNIPSVQVVNGKRGLVEGVDYRGKKVLAYLMAVPDSPWFIHNKIDEEEAFSQLHLDALFIGLITGALILLTAASIAFFHRHSQAKDFRALYESEQQKLAAETGLWAANQKLALLFEQTPLGVIEWDTEFRVARWNPAAERIFGFSAAEAIGQHVHFIVPEAVHPLVAPIMQALLDGRGGGRSTNENVRKDGTVIQCEWYNTALTDAEGHLVGVASQVDDITNRKRAENALLASEARNRAVTQSAHDGILTADQAGIIVGWNRGAEAIFGHTEAEAMGQPLALLIPDRYRNAHLAGMDRVGSGGAHRIIGRMVELHGLRKDGTEFPLELSLAKWETINGWFVTGIIRDITERKKAEEALHKQAEQLRTSNSQLSRFNQMAVDRELRMIELKREVDELCVKLGETHRYYGNLDDEPVAPT